MRKYILLLAIAAMALPACSKGSQADIVGGRSEEYNWGGRSYMMYIADNLTTDALDELELALQTEQRGTGLSAHFQMSGSLYQPGSAWTVTADNSRLPGLKIEGKGDSKFLLSYNDDYAFTDVYPTQFTMEAVQLKDGEGAPGNWRVWLKGERNEREGYRCTFETPDGIQYGNTLGLQSKGWNQVFGDLYMIVYKNRSTVDLCCLSFTGAPSQAKYTRGL